MKVVKSYDSLLLAKIATMIVFFGYSFYSIIDKQNAITKLSLAIPQVAKELREVREENSRLRYQIEVFESPSHLMELAAAQQSSALLKQPLEKEILTVTVDYPVSSHRTGQEITPSSDRSQLSLAALLFPHKN